MRARAWVVSGALLAGAAGIFACSTPTGFQCSNDAQCRLNDRPGVCVDTEHCAYPDTECPSGLRYPPGAGTLGGMCVPGELTPASTGQAGTATDDPSTGATSQPDPSMTAGGQSTGPPPLTTTPTSMSGPSTDSMACARDDHPDAPDDVMPTETTGDNPDCQAEWYGMINDAEVEDLDYLVWEPSCIGGTFIMNDLGLGDPVGICAIPHCNRTPKACLSGTWDEGVQMCCRDADATLAVDGSSGADCQDGTSTLWDVLVRGTGCYEWGVVFSIG